jgi:hypothetical protein
VDVNAWQQRLEKEFAIGGIVGSKLFPVFDQENACGSDYALRYHGHAVMMDSFQTHYIDTMKAVYGLIMQSGWPHNSLSYPPILVLYAVNFRTIRACESLAGKGYWLEGYGLLRDLKDRALTLIAIGTNLSSFAKLYSTISPKSAINEDLRREKNALIREERRIHDLIIGDSSGLPENTLKHLKIWEEFFHREVHGSRLAFIQELSNLLENRMPPNLGPSPNEMSAAMYMNRLTEISWILLRLLRYLQPNRLAFDTKWRIRQALLDDSFRVMVEEFAKSGKKVGDAFLQFIDCKCQFDDELFYFEADGGRCSE